ncbi:MAG: uridine kinase [Phycisphaerales bacterium JB059]
MDEAFRQPEGSARRLSWDEAPGAILASAHALRRDDRPVLVGVSGPVGSGKSTLARRLGGVVVSTDDYLPDYEGLPEHERDLPERADLDRLSDNLDALRSGRPTTAPEWSFNTHRRVGERRVEPAPIVVCEGIHALHGRIAELHDLRVFVESPRDVRWARWKAIEEASERGWGVERARAFFERVAEPTFQARSETYRATAHVIVINDQHNDE